MIEPQKSLAGIALARFQTIPPMTEPLGRHWQQPDPDAILVDEHHAVMTRESFEQLLEYTGTIPTGAYAGKMWRRHQVDIDARRGGVFSSLWLLCWYSDDPEHAGYCRINYREILIA